MPGRVLGWMVSMTIAAALPAQAADLGDPAAPLKIAEWVKGAPVDLQAGIGKNVYVVEFWATWCGPCIASMPHLTQMQSKFKDKGVVFIGVTRKDDRQDLEKVKSFVKNRGADMGYTVAFDKEQETWDAYMKAFNKGGIPQAFLVDTKGKVVWEGHPMLGLEQVVETVLSGKYDIESLAAISRKAEAEFAETNRMLGEYLDLVRTSKEAKGAKEIGEQLLKRAGTDAQLMNTLAWTILDDERVLSRDLDIAMRAAKAAYDACAGKNAAIVDTYARALFDTGKVKEAIEYQRKAVELAKDDEFLLAELQKALQRYEKAAAGGD